MDKDSRYYYRKAKKRVKDKKEFYQHLTSFIGVNISLFVINVVMSPRDIWFIYPLLFWGLALVFHYLSVFGLPGTGKLSAEWEEQEIEMEVQKLRQADGYIAEEMSEENEEMPDEYVPEERLELKEFRKLRKEWDESDFV